MKRLLLVFVTAATALAACANEPTTYRTSTATYTPPASPTPAEYQFPTKYAGDFTVVWSAEPDIDLFSRPAEIVRATGEAESMDRIPSNLNYPGAVDANAIYARDMLDRGTRPVEGTLYLYLLHLSSTAETVTATTCKIHAGLVTLGRRGPRSSTVAVGSVYYLTAQLPPGTRDVRSETIHGTRAGAGDRAPRYNAFQPWTVKYYAPGLLDKELQPADKQACNQKAIDIARTVPAYQNQIAEFPQLEPRGYTDADFPRQPQFPGWPAP